MERANEYPAELLRRESPPFPAKTRFSRAIEKFTGSFYPNLSKMKSTTIILIKIFELIVNFNFPKKFFIDLKDLYLFGASRF